MTPAPSILTTKLHLPRPDARQVKRSRLSALIQGGADCRLTLVSAPPGFGKTSAVAAWIASHPEAPHVAWLSLDEADNDPVRFWNHFLAALGGRLGDFKDRAFAFLDAPLPSYRALVEGILNALASDPQPLILVLDDFHALAHPALLEGIAQLSEHLPDGMRLVLVTRADPSVPLARLRAQGKLSEVRAADLRFTDSEAADFLLATMGLELDPADRATLLRTTEGWIAGLQLAALSLRRAPDPRAFITAFAGTNRYVMDYLAEEALSLQSEPLQRFLMETSILERFDAVLCAALTGRSDSQDLLEALDQANLFLVPLDEERRWYRYHHLFADMLRHHLQKRDPDRAQELHAGASRWFEAHGASVEAIAHALKAQDYDRAADLVVSAEDVLRRGEVSTLVSALKALPEACFDRRADLNLLMAWVLFPSGQAEPLKRCLRRAEPVAVPGDAPRLLAVKSFVARIEGDFPAAVAFARDALVDLAVEDWMWYTAVALTMASCLQLGDRLEEAEDAYDRAIAACLRQGDSLFSVMAQGLKGALLLDQGRLTEAHALLSETLRQVEARTGRGWPPISYVLSSLSGVMALRGHLEEGLTLAEAGMAAGEGFVEPTVNSLHALAAIRLRARHGVLAEAALLTERAREVASRHRLTYLDGYLEVQRALHGGTTGPADREAMLAWERAMGPRLLEGPPHWPLRDGRRLLAKLRLATERPADGIALLERVEADALRVGRMPLAIAARASLALALDAAGERERALSVLEAALSAAEPEGVLAPFLEEGEPMRRLLDVWLRRGAPTAVLGAFVKRLVPDAADDGGLVEPLSAREREVLALIAEGMSNQAIADHLGIELSTVKRHSSNLLGKLGASNRTQAVAMGRRHGWF